MWITKVFPPKPMIQTIIYMSGIRTPATLGPEETSGTVVLVELVALNSVSFRSLSLNMSRNRGSPGEGLAELPFSHISSIVSIGKWDDTFGCALSVALSFCHLSSLPSVLLEKKNQLITNVNGWHLVHFWEWNTRTLHASLFSMDMYWYFLRAYVLLNSKIHFFWKDTLQLWTLCMLTMFGFKIQGDWATQTVQVVFAEQKHKTMYFSLKMKTFLSNIYQSIKTSYVWILFTSLSLKLDLFSRFCKSQQTKETSTSDQECL